jgi:hypothetical protein
MVKKIILIVVVAGIVVFGLIQLVPYGRNHTNPPVVQEIQWDLPETRALAQRACFDCHSNETVWPWYSSIAPSSWLLAMDVAEGRDHMNFSEWGSRPQSADEIARELERRSMPPGRSAPRGPSERCGDRPISRRAPEIYPVSVGTFKRLNVETVTRKANRRIVGRIGRYAARPEAGQAVAR